MRTDFPPPLRVDLSAMTFAIYLSPRKAFAALALAGACTGAAWAQSPPGEPAALHQVELPLPSGTVLRAHWWPAPQPSSAQANASVQPAVLALHGCGGLFAKAGVLSSRYRETAETLHAAGYAVLMPDSFGSRGLRDVCQTRYSDRSLNVNDRVQDARAALVLSLIHI